LGSKAGAALYPPNKINPVSKIKELQPTCREVAIYSIEDLRQIVEKCGVLLFPYVALVLFGGFRPSEAAIALWKDISRAARTLSALKTKKNKRRNHRMPSNLDLALDLYRACTGIVCAVPDPAAELNALLRSLNIKAIQDGLRHCFCSYVYRYMTDVLQIPNAKEWIAKWMCNSVADIDKNYLNENVSTEDSIVSWRSCRLFRVFSRKRSRRIPRRSM
jgi:integrase